MGGEGDEEDGGVAGVLGAAVEAMLGAPAHISMGGTCQLKPTTATTNPAMLGTNLLHDIDQAAQVRAWWRDRGLQLQPLKPWPLQLHAGRRAERALCCVTACVATRVRRRAWWPPSRTRRPRRPAALRGA